MPSEATEFYKLPEPYSILPGRHCAVPACCLPECELLTVRQSTDPTVTDLPQIVIYLQTTDRVVVEAAEPDFSQPIAATIN
ncbi:MAG: hypothetical protein ABI221_02115 [Candidatus Saccharimonadales bacterium]